MAWCCRSGGSTIGLPWLMAGGALLLVSGVLHGIVGLISGDDWTGPLSLRKPALFGLATGVTLVSLIPVYRLIRNVSPVARAVRAGSIILCLAAVIEVALITAQSWRGVPSHFNTATSIDTVIHYAIDILALLLTLVVAWWTVLACNPRIAQPEIPRHWILSIRSGMILLLVSCILGVWMSLYGTARVKEALAPEIFGQAGILKFVHGTPMHAIQFLLIGSWRLDRSRIGDGVGFRLTKLSVAGFVMVSVFAGYQTFSGRSRFEFDLLSVLLLASGVMALASSWIMIAYYALRSEGVDSPSPG